MTPPKEDLPSDNGSSSPSIHVGARLLNDFSLLHGNKKFITGPVLQRFLDDPQRGLDETTRSSLSHKLELDQSGSPKVKPADFQNAVNSVFEFDETSPKARVTPLSGGADNRKFPVERNGSDSEQTISPHGLEFLETQIQGLQSDVASVKQELETIRNQGHIEFPKLAEFVLSVDAKFQTISESLKEFRSE